MYKAFLRNTFVHSFRTGGRTFVELVDEKSSLWYSGSGREQTRGFEGFLFEPKDVDAGGGRHLVLGW